MSNHWTYVVLEDLAQEQNLSLRALAWADRLAAELSQWDAENDLAQDYDAWRKGQG